MNGAKADICRALRERKMRFKRTFERVTFRGATVDPQSMRQMIFEDRNRFRLLVPADLDPADIDWKRSRPRKPWPYGEDYFAHVARLELSANDIRKAFDLDEANEREKRAASADARGEALQTSVSGRQTPGKWARRAINEKWPAGVPSQAELPNDDLIKAATGFAKSKGWRIGGRDTILRAAGRRRN